MPTWSFETGNPPFLRNQSPSPGASDQGASVLISVDVLDAESYVDAYDAYVDGAVAWNRSSGFVAPYDGPLSSVTSVNVDGYDGYRIVIDRTSPFSYGTSVSVRIVADDYGSNQIDDTWYFEVGSPPFLRNQNPSPGASEQPVDTLISVDVLDAESYVDGYDAYVDGAVAWDRSSGFVAPYDGPLSSVTSVNVDGYDGYRIVIDKTAPYDYYTTVIVRIVADDYGGNQLDEDWSFLTTIGSPPVVTNEFPTPGSSGIDTDVLISFDVYDPDGNLDSYDAYVDGALAWDSSASSFLSPYDGPGSMVSAVLVDGHDGYHVVIDKTALYVLGTTIPVQVTAKDPFFQTDASWSFTIETGPAPEITNESPAPDATGVDPRALISCDIFDRDNNMDLSTVRVWVNGALGFDSSSGFWFPFAGPGSMAYPTVVGSYDGYHVQLEPTADMSGLTTVRVEALDAYANLGGGSWSFLIAGTVRNFIYYSDGYGVHRIHMSDLAGESQDAAVKILSTDTTPALGTDEVTTLFGAEKDGYMFLLTSMRAPGGVLVTRNEVNDPRYYLDGYDAYGAQMTPDGTMYVINRTLNRVEVYYGADFRPGGRAPDFVYDGYSTPSLMGGTLLDLHVAPGFSVVSSGRTRFYTGSAWGMTRVDTYDEMSPDGYSAGMDGFGLSWTYGVAGSGADYEQVGSPTDPNTAQPVVAVHSDDEANLIYVLTEDGDGYGGLTQINLSSHRRILFMDRQGGFLPSNYVRDIYGKNS